MITTSINPALLAPTQGHRHVRIRDTRNPFGRAITSRASESRKAGQWCPYLLTPKVTRRVLASLESGGDTATLLADGLREA
ncbi:hypothetical protein GCM10027280_37320 [Micromonospora polyrhachis]